MIAAMTDQPAASAELREVGDAYRRSREETERLRNDLTQRIRDAYAGGMRKAEIMRAINHAWTDRHVDGLLKDVTPPEGTIVRGTRKSAKPK